jgi:hypothetical protein
MHSTHAIFHRPAPEDLELAYRRRELAGLRAALAERESHLDALRNQLNAFEGRYIRQVGVLYIQLDEWHDRLAELNDPTTPKSAIPIDFSSRPESSPSHREDAAERPASRTGDDPSVNPTPYLKSLFREVAKRIHPDHARDYDDERHRTQLMAQANAALLREDAALLHRMLHSHDLPIEPTDARTELTRTLALLRHLQRDLIALHSEMEALANSEMADLQRRTAVAAAEGNDLLAELAARVKGRIGSAMSRYERELARRRTKQRAVDPTPLLSAEAPDS